MKQYLLSVHMVEGQPQPSEDVMQQMYKDVDVFNQRLQAEGAWVFAGGLYPADVATVVRTEGGAGRDDRRAVRGVQGAGRRVLGASRPTDLDAALRLAADASAACQGPVEVRPFQDDPAE